MCEYYFDEDRALAFKINSINSAFVYEEDQNNPKTILVHTNVKVTNFKKEKIRRILSETYPTDMYDFESAEKEFSNKLLAKLIDGAKKISEQEYETIKAKVEASA
ncbi:hypothetical protein [Candidatus Contubernalis alkaliaceticus]|uniref:hypothetical protein n=1 Tax=Candidatus Contubernalis alkaliaceticus TaxID=338645 RepID=UPI001F4C062D|nr:hypothetical protein [Candidatus Contubernalis alkalaceticus]UNC91392.1 hypothetical protein HUE98_04380 [Candidatus Contubernalis alkalaceticus]